MCVDATRRGEASKNTRRTIVSYPGLERLNTGQEENQTHQSEARSIKKGRFSCRFPFLYQTTPFISSASSTIPIFSVPPHQTIKPQIKRLSPRHVFDQECSSRRCMFFLNHNITSQPFTLHLAFPYISNTDTLSGRRPHLRPSTPHSSQGFRSLRRNLTSPFSPAHQALLHFHGASTSLNMITTTQISPMCCATSTSTPS